MATLQKFKLLATQCGVAQSPTLSTRKSTAVHLRQRRKTTLRMLLGIRSPRRQEPPIHHRRSVAPLPERKRDTLKNWFIPATAFDEELERRRRGAERGDVNHWRFWRRVCRMKVNGLGDGLGSPRPGWIGFRHRSVLRRAWRPMLVSIPERDNF